MANTSSFWSSSALEPKRQYRFRLTITGVEGAAIWFAKKVTVPTFTVGEVKHSFVDKTFYFPGRVEWNTIECTLVDPVNPDATNIMHKILVKSGYFIPPTTSDDESWGSMGKEDAVNAIKQWTIDVIDEEGKAIESWNLHNPWIKSAKFGDLSYDSDELREITLEVRYDWAKCQIGGVEHHKTAASKALAKQQSGAG